MSLNGLVCISWDPEHADSRFRLQTKLWMPELDQSGMMGYEYSGDILFSSPILQFSQIPFIVKKSHKFLYINLQWPKLVYNVQSYKWWTIRLEHLDAIIQPVTHKKKAITIKHNAAWTIEFTSSPPTLAKGGEECTGQLEYSNTMVSIVRYIYIVVCNVYSPRSVKFPWSTLVTKLPEVAMIIVGVQDLNSIVAPFTHIDIPLAIQG